MMRLAVSLVILACFATIVFAAPRNGAATGNDLRGAVESVRVGYALGFSDAIAVAFTAERNGGNVTRLSECLTGMQIGQIQAILEKYLSDHPEEWHHATGAIMVNAIGAACLKR